MSEPSSTPPEPSSSRAAAMRRMPVIIGAAVVLVIVAGVFWYRAAGRAATDDAQLNAHISMIAARVGGTVLEVVVNDNQAVEAGDVLLRIDPRDVEVQLARAKAELADAQAAVAGAESGLPIVQTTSSSDVERTAGSSAGAEAAVAAASSDVEAAHARHRAAQARLAEAEATAVRTAKDRERFEGLVKKEEISQQQYDAAVAAERVAEAAVASAQAAVAEAATAIKVAESRVAQSRAGLVQAQAQARAARTGPEQVRTAQARFESAQARVDQARAAVRDAELRLEYTTVKSPVKGVASRRTVEPGQVVQPGQTLLAVVGSEQIWVTANYKETDLEHIRPGQRAAVSVDAFGGEEFAARVDSIGAATGATFSLLPANNASGNFVKVVQRVPVKIVFEPGQDLSRLRPGLSVEPTIYTR